MVEMKTVIASEPAHIINPSFHCPKFLIWYQPPILTECWSDNVKFSSGLVYFSSFSSKFFFCFLEFCYILIFRWINSFFCILSPLRLLGVHIAYGAVPCEVATRLAMTVSRWPVWCSLG
jgi:hypothetical protein